MSRREMLGELKKDYPEVMDYIMKASDNYEPKFKKGKLRKPLLRMYTTENRNDWLCVIYWDGEEMRYSLGILAPDQETNSYQFGYVVGYHEIMVLFFTKHFFDRYAERLGLTTDRDQTIKEFMVNDGYFAEVKKEIIADNVA
ncbi:hypothetical protein ACFLU5_12140 [Bacteroidota bacterium]